MTTAPPTLLTRSQDGVAHAHLASGLAGRYRVGELVELDGVADGVATTRPVGLDAARLAGLRRHGRFRHEELARLTGRRRSLPLITPTTTGPEGSR